MFLPKQMFPMSCARKRQDHSRRHYKICKRILNKSCVSCCDSEVHRRGGWMTTAIVGPPFREFRLVKFLHLSEWFSGGMVAKAKTTSVCCCRLRTVKQDRNMKLQTCWDKSALIPAGYDKREKPNLIKKTLTHPHSLYVRWQTCLVCQLVSKRVATHSL